jgi:hypothetical protein
MQPFSVRPRFTVLALLLLVLTACGDKKGAVPVPVKALDVCTCTCTGTSVTILVDEGKPRGVDKKAVYVCPNLTINWQAAPGSNVTHFRVEFVGDDLPFGSGPSNTIFDSDANVQVTTPALPDPGELTVFKYKITITDNHGPHQPHDPHVVGGGGH